MEQAINSYSLWAPDSQPQEQEAMIVALFGTITTIGLSLNIFVIYKMSKLAKNDRDQVITLVIFIPTQLSSVHKRHRSLSSRDGSLRHRLTRVQLRSTPSGHISSRSTTNIPRNQLQGN